MKFAVLSLNPGIDRAIYLSAPLNQGHTNRAARTVTTQGSKGANVAILLRRLGHDVTYYAFSGGLYGQLCEEILAKEGVAAVYTPAACGIRVNTKVIDGAGVKTELNEKGGPVTEEEYTALTQAFLQDEAPVVFLCGSFPQGVETTAYRDLILAEKSRGRTVVLDCDGPALATAVTASPAIIKPNTDELMGLLKSTGLCGELPENPEKTPGFLPEACAKVAESYGIGTVLCTMGPAGACGYHDGKTWICPAADVECVGFSGAGDSFLTGFVSARYAQGKNDPEALQFASACAGAKILLEGTVLPTAESVNNVLSAHQRDSKEW